MAGSSDSAYDANDGAQAAACTSAQGRCDDELLAPLTVAAAAPLAVMALLLQLLLPRDWSENTLGYSLIKLLASESAAAARRREVLAPLLVWPA